MLLLLLRCIFTGGCYAIASPLASLFYYVSTNEKYPVCLEQSVGVFACLHACQEGYIRQLLFDNLKDEPDVTFVEHHLDGPEDVLSVSPREFWPSFKEYALRE